MGGKVQEAGRKESGTEVNILVKMRCKEGV